MPSRYVPPSKNNKKHLINEEFGKAFGRIQPGFFAPVILNSRQDAWTDAMFGLMPYSADAGRFETSYNARLETANLLEPYKGAWDQRQLCIVPVQTFFAPSFETGSFTLHSIEREDGDWFFIAGLWEVRSGRAGDMFSFANITLDASEHCLMSRFGKGAEDKRMPVILTEENCFGFLNAKTDAELIGYCKAFDPDGWKTTSLEATWKKKKPAQQ